MNQSAYLSNLTPLRGMAALFVVLHHAQVYVNPVNDAAVSQFVSQSYLWTDFFFVLSGFVLSHVYGASFTQSVTKPRVLKYMGARFARIYPLHLFTLIWTALVVFFIRQEATFIDPFLLENLFTYWGIPASLLLIQALHLFKLAPMNGPSWSLSTEWWVYLLFPFLVYWLHGFRMRGKVLLLLAIVGLYVGLVYYLAPYYSMQHKVTLSLTSDWGLPRCLAGFVLGMLCYEVYNQNWGRPLIGSSLFLVLGFGSALFAMHAGANDLLTVAIFPFIVLSAAYQTSWIKRILETRPLQRLGDWSFSIYMVHVPIISTFYLVWVHANPLLLAHFSLEAPAHPDYRQGQIFAIILIVLTLIVSALTYRFIEVPARNYLNARFNAQRKEPLAVAM